MNRSKRTGLVFGVLVLPVLAGGLFSCQQDRGEAPESGQAVTGDPEKVVATVDAKEIHLREVDRLVGLWREGGMPGADTMAARNLQERALETLIDQEVLLAASREGGFAPGPEEIETRLESFADRYPNPEAFRNALDAQGMTEEEFRETMISDLAIRRYLQETIPDTSAVGPNEARAFYDQNPQLFQTGERYHARHIFIEAPQLDETATEEARAADARAREKADSLLAVIRDGADFATVAREASEDESAERGGDLGEFGRGAMVPGLETVYALEEGETSGVLRSSAGYHIFRMEERLASEAVPYGPQLETRLVNQLRGEQQGLAVQQRIQELRAEAAIERNL